MMIKKHPSPITTRHAILSATLLVTGSLFGISKKPNVLFIFADQWRAQAMGYNEDPNARTPHFDQIAREGINFSNAVSCQPISSPFRASLLTGQFPTTHGMINNDLPLLPTSSTWGELFKKAGYATGYIGKWHLNGGDRLAFIPENRRFGFDYWKVMNCTHKYDNSYYWGETPTKEKWDGYDAFAQVDSTLDFIKKTTDKERPFCMVLSWGPPHDPYNLAPQEYKELYKNTSKIKLRPNVPAEFSNKAQAQLAGYYAHIAALDEAFGTIIEGLRKLGVLDNTIIVFTSDHGDMLFSHGFEKKSRPYDESIRVPMIMRYPQAASNKVIDEPMSTPDILPTLLDMCGITIPKSIEGRSFLPIITGKKASKDEGALVMWPITRKEYKLSEYRCIRTKRYTYVETLQGPWLFFDNQKDPFQLDNLINDPSYSSLIKEHQKKLLKLRIKANDQFKDESYYRTKFNANKPQKTVKQKESSFTK